MKRLRTFLPLICFLPVFVSAQFIASNDRKVSGPNLGIESAVPATQEWVKTDDQLVGRINNSSLLRMQDVTSSIVNVFHTSLLNEDQAIAVWHGEYYSAKNSPSPLNKFVAVCQFQDQKARLQVVANDISPLLGHVVLNNQDFLTLRPVIAVKNGAPYFEYTVNGKVNKAWLIADANDPELYTPVTRKEYLMQARQDLAGQKNAIAADLRQQEPPRSQAVQDAEKKAAIEQLSFLFSGVELQTRIKVYEAHYKTDEAYLKERVDVEAAQLDSTMHFVDTLLKQLSPAELNQPAIVSGLVSEFEGFSDAQHGQMVIKMNPAFFNTIAGGEKAHFFVVSLSYDAASADAAGLDKRLSAQFDAQQLKGLLGR